MRRISGALETTAVTSSAVNRKNSCPLIGSFCCRLYLCDLHHHHHPDVWTFSSVLTKDCSVQQTEVRGNAGGNRFLNKYDLWRGEADKRNVTKRFGWGEAVLLLIVAPRCWQLLIIFFMDSSTNAWQISTQGWCHSCAGGKFRCGEVVKNILPVADSSLDDQFLWEDRWAKTFPVYQKKKKKKRPDESENHHKVFVDFVFL